MRVYQIQLSSPELTCDINQRFDGRAMRVKTKLRNIELEILDTCFSRLAQSVGTLVEYHACISVVQQFQTLPETVSVINFKKHEIEGLLKGFSLTADARPVEWARAIAFISQVNAPKEIELPDVAN